MSLFPIAYFPCISYVAHFLADSNPIIEIFDTYHKQTCRNRCYVMTANGVQSLSVPVKQVNGNHTMTKDMVISPVEPWQQIHRRCLESAYKASPYFDHYYGTLSPIFEQHFDRLIDLNNATIKAVFKILKVKKEIAYTNDYVKEAEKDYRDIFVKRSPSPQVSKSYYQVFENKYSFAPDLSILDLIFNEGPEAMDYLSGYAILT